MMFIFDNSTMILPAYVTAQILSHLLSAFNFKRNAFSSISLESPFQRVEQSQTKKYKVEEKKEHKINFPLNFLN